MKAILVNAKIWYCIFIKITIFNYIDLKLNYLTDVMSLKVKVI